MAESQKPKVAGLLRARRTERFEALLLALASGHKRKAVQEEIIHVIQSLPKLIEKATSRDLSNQIDRLEQVFQKLGKQPKGVQCQAIDGLIDEADEIVGEVADKDVLDAAIVGSAQAVEHYEIARYGTLIAWADSLGHDDIIRLLNTNLNEEKAADKKLSTVALRKGVNRKAAS